MGGASDEKTTRVREQTMSRMLTLRVTVEAWEALVEVIRSTGITVEWTVGENGVIDVLFSKTFSEQS